MFCEAKPNLEVLNDQNLDAALDFLGKVQTILVEQQQKSKQAQISHYLSFWLHQLYYNIKKWVFEHK